MITGKKVSWRGLLRASKGVCLGLIAPPECSDFTFKASDEKEKPFTEKKERKMKNSAS
jgi:hypothetical protein